MNPHYSKEHLLDETYNLLIEKGIKSTTMDTVARHLKISKRTLYEIFGNKNDLITQTLERHHSCHLLKCKEAMENSSNIMEGILKVTKINRDDISKVGIDFFRDMDRLYPALRKGYDNSRRNMYEQMSETFRKGVEQGVFRPDTNFRALTFILEIWMESIKKIERPLPEELTHVDLFDAMTVTFLRTIVAPSFMHMLDSL